MVGTHEENNELFGDELMSESLLDHLPDISEEARRKWPRDLAALIDMYQATLIRMKYSPAESQKIAYTLLAELSTYCGGRYIYLPKSDALEKAIRDVDLFRDWRDRNLTPDDLARRYKISLQHVYRVIAEQRRYHVNKIQGQLF